MYRIKILLLLIFVAGMIMAACDAIDDDTSAQVMKKTSTKQVKEDASDGTLAEKPKGVAYTLSPETMN